MSQNEKRETAILNFFDTYGIEDTKKYLQELFAEYLAADTDKDVLDCTNTYWFTEELKAFISDLEPFDKRKKRLETELALLA